MQFHVLYRKDLAPKSLTLWAKFRKIECHNVNLHKNAVILVVDFVF